MIKNFSDQSLLLAVIKVSSFQFKYRYKANLDPKFDLLYAVKLV